jgi:hypothetical protein
MNDKIQSITIVNQQGTKSYYASEHIEIINKTIEYPDAIEWYYEVKQDGKLLAEIINCPVNIEYYIEPDVDAPL